ETGPSGSSCPREPQPARRNEFGARFSTNEKNETNSRIGSAGVAGLLADLAHGRPARHGRTDREGGTTGLQNGEAGKRPYVIPARASPIASRQLPLAAEIRRLDWRSGRARGISFPHCESVAQRDHHPNGRSAFG